MTEAPKAPTRQSLSFASTQQFGGYPLDKAARGIKTKICLCGSESLLFHRLPFQDRLHIPVVGFYPYVPLGEAILLQLPKIVSPPRRFTFRNAETVFEVPTEHEVAAPPVCIILMRLTFVSPAGSGTVVTHFCSRREESSEQKTVLIKSNWSTWNASASV